MVSISTCIISINRFFYSLVDLTVKRCKLDLFELLWSRSPSHPAESQGLSSAFSPPLLFWGSGWLCLSLQAGSSNGSLWAKPCLLDTRVLQPSLLSCGSRFPKLKVVAGRESLVCCGTVSRGGLVFRVAQCCSPWVARVLVLLRTMTGHTANNLYYLLIWIHNWNLWGEKALWNSVISSFC